MSRHLLHIGYPKAGSTFLQRWFEAHPQLAYREGGIAGFRSVYGMAREAAAGDAEPLYRVTSTEALSIPTTDAGSIVVDYEARRNTDIVAAQQRICTMLAELFPHAFVLMVTRGYRSMILSTYSQFVRSGGHVDFAQLLEIARTHEHDRIAPWDYDRQIRAYESAFGAENVIVMPYEMLRDDATAFTRHLADRLGILHFEGRTARVNESLSPAEMYWYPRFARLIVATRSRRLHALYTRASFTNRLRRPIALLEKLRPGRGITDAMITADVVEPFRGRAETLRGNPLYAPYQREYLLF
jgi:hypothetical protein